MYIANKQFPFGIKTCLVIGESGRGRTQRTLIINGFEATDDECESLNKKPGDRQQGFDESTPEYLARKNEKSGVEKLLNDFVFIKKDGRITSLAYRKGANSLRYFDSYGGYSRRHNGIVTFYDAATNEEIENTEAFAVRTNGADGDAGRIGQWDIVLYEKSNQRYCVVDYSGHYDEKCSLEINGTVFNYDSMSELKETITQYFIKIGKAISFGHTPR